jgi:hypothetical protein
MLPRILETSLEWTRLAYFYINTAKSFKQNGGVAKDSRLSTLQAIQADDTQELEPQAH